MTRLLTFRLSAIMTIALLLAAVILPTASVSALTSSSLTLSEGRPGEASSYTFSTNGLDTGTTIDCIQLDIGTSTDGSGDAGLTVTGATLGTNTIPSAGSWTVGVDEGTDKLQATGGSATPNGSGSITWNAVTNGSTPDVTYFALFETYTNSDCSTGLTDSVVVTLMYKDGALVSLTIDPTLTFTVAGVASGNPINGAGNTTVTSTAGAVAFLNSVTSGSPGLSAHNVTVGTNASAGYTVYLRHTGLLTNGASDTIDNWTGTNGTPTSSFPTTAEAWGYTTEDTSLSATGDGANRFGSDEWAGFSTSNQEVIYSATPQASESTQVGHQVSVAASTEAGTYQTTIVYTAASVY